MKNNLYIRFGEIPEDGLSRRYNCGIEVGTEKGLSVYHAIILDDGRIALGLSLPITKTTLFTQQNLLQYENRPCYLVRGDFVGSGSDGEPLIKNVEIVKEIMEYRKKEPSVEENNKNEQLCGGLEQVRNNDFDGQDNWHSKSEMVDVLDFNEEETSKIEECLVEFYNGAVLLPEDKNGERDKKVAKEYLKSHAKRIKMIVENMS